MSKALKHRETKRLSASRFFVAVLAVAVLAGGVYFARKSGSNPAVYGNDFNVYYHAGQEIIAGHDPYESSLGEWTPYIYLPLLAEVITPLALLPLPVAAYLWFLINASAIVIAAWMSAKIVTGHREQNASESRLTSRSESWRLAIAAIAVVMVFRFVLDSFNLGQINPLVSALAVAHVYFYLRKRPVLSVMALVLAISFKLTPVLLIFYHIGKLRLKFAGACIAVLVLVTGVSFLPFGTRGLDAFQTFVNRTVRNEQGYDLRYSGNQSLRGMISRLRAPDDGIPQSANDSDVLSDTLTLLIWIILLGFAIVAAARAGNEAAGVAPFFCGMVLLSPLSWKAHYVILILPLAWLISITAGRLKENVWTVSTLAVVFALFSLTSPRVIGLAAAEWADYHSLVFAGGLLIFIASVVTAVTRKFGKHRGVC